MKEKKGKKERTWKIDIERNPRWKLPCGHKKALHGRSGAPKGKWGGRGRTRNPACKIPSGGGGGTETYAREHKNTDIQATGNILKMPEKNCLFAAAKGRRILVRILFFSTTNSAMLLPLFRWKEKKKGKQQQRWNKVESNRIQSRFKLFFRIDVELF